MARPKKQATCHPDRLHDSLGLCSECYQRQWRQRRGAPGNVGYAKTPEHRAKLSAALKGRKRGPLSPEHRANVSAGRVRHGHTRGHVSTPTYQSWQDAKKRCFNPSQKDYANYGGRGITVCDRWLIFENFLADMGERPEGTTLGRFGDEGDYEPGNVAWMTPAEQVANRRTRTAVVACAA